jgi:hypothetical protein
MIHVVSASFVPDPIMVLRIYSLLELLGLAHMEFLIIHNKS